MAVSEVQDLRRRGQWQQALDVALADHRMLDNEWTQMSLFWVMHDMCNVALQLPNGMGDEVALGCLSRMQKLLRTMQDDGKLGDRAFRTLVNRLAPSASTVEYCEHLSHTDPVKAYAFLKAPDVPPISQLHPLLHDYYGWILFRYAQHQCDVLTSVQGRTLLRDYLLLSTERPSLLHSNMLEFALYLVRRFHEFNITRFTEMWDLQYLRPEDKQPHWINNRVYPSLAFRLHHRIVAVSGEEVADEMFQGIDYKE